MQLPNFKLERYFAKYEFEVEYLLCSSDCESATVEEVLALEPGAMERFREHWLGYTESQGSRALRREICRLYTTIGPEQVLVHSGAEEAIFLFMHAVLEPGDHVIVHWPCYQSLAAVAGSIGCSVTHWDAHEERDWALDLDELRRHLRSNTRAIVVNLPHNPTGYLMPQDQFAQVVEIASSHGVTLFSDEVYRESEYATEERLEAACDLDQSAVSLGVLSKTYGLAGLRIGWAATRNAEVYERMAALKDYTTICNSAPSEFLAELALRHRDKLIERNVGIILENLVLLDAFFERRSDTFAWQRPKAGPIAFPRLLDGDIEAFCDRLVKQDGVLLLPGTLFDDTENHFRIGLGRKNMPEALARLEEHCDRVRLAR
ncbi:MAG: aminotransferase class I/II-fold pyridoxal phosphate-dependent enzyme [Anaerolineae bacterium]|jgi:aspartate/methionine/tyrosine aminotransferase